MQQRTRHLPPLLHVAAVLLAGAAVFSAGIGAAHVAPDKSKPRKPPPTTTTSTTPTTTTTTTTTTPATTTTTTTPAPAPFRIRGMYDRDSSATGFDDEKAVGIDLIDTGPYADLVDQLAANGLKGMIWLGGYDNTTCQFRNSDSWVVSHVSAIAGHAGVGAYFVDDEPDAVACPTAPAQMKARSDLVHSLDPGSTTFIVAYRQLASFAHTVDVIGLDHYPCSFEHGCDYSKIDQQAAEADSLGIRYWGVVQAFQDSWYRLPTADELHEQFAHWRATHMEGYLVYAWHAGSDPSAWLANHLELLSQLAIENAQ